MAYLLLDKKDDHIRRWKDNAFNYNFENSLWRQVEIEGKTSDELYEDYPLPEIELMSDGRHKWYDSDSDKWYVLKDRKVHDRRYDSETGEIILTIPEISENFEEEVV